MSAPLHRLSLARGPGVALAGAALLLGGCGASESTTGTPVAAGSTSACATAAAAAGSCAAGAPGATPGGCTSRGSSRSDRFAEQVALSPRPDGLQVGDLSAGAGPPAQNGQQLTVEYTGWLSDGTVFDSSRKPGGQPFTLVLGQGNVIPGWDEGLVGAHAGAVRRLVIPPALGYGAAGQGPIPPNATLVFDVEVLCVG